jgi:Protein tyrosine and serine/threonine kinase
MEGVDRRAQGARAGLLVPGVALGAGRFRVERLLGVWGVRALYAAMDAETSQRGILAEFVVPGSTNVAAQMRRLMGLEHPFLPLVLAFFQRDGLLYLALDLVEAAPLDQVLAGQPAGLAGASQAISWGLQICDGLRFLAAQQPPLVAADLAPAAVLLTPHDRMKLVGLGNLLGLYSIAGMVGALEQGYTAPEVYGGRLDGRSDVYALGALLHRSLSGMQPASYPPGALPPLRSLRPDIPPELDATIARAVALRPADRWPDAASFGAALREAEAALADQSAILVLDDATAAGTPSEVLGEMAGTAAQPTGGSSAPPDAARGASFHPQPPDVAPASPASPASPDDRPPHLPPSIVVSGGAPGVSSSAPPNLLPRPGDPSPISATPSAILQVEQTAHAGPRAPQHDAPLVPETLASATAWRREETLPLSGLSARPAPPATAPSAPRSQPGVFGRLFGRRRHGPEARP